MESNVTTVSVDTSTHAHTHTHTRYIHILCECLDETANVHFTFMRVCCRVKGYAAVLLMSDTLIFSHSLSCTQTLTQAHTHSLSTQELCLKACQSRCDDSSPKMTNESDFSFTMSLRYNSKVFWERFTFFPYFRSPEWLRLNEQVLRINMDETVQSISLRWGEVKRWRWQHRRLAYQHFYVCISATAEVLFMADHLSEANKNCR